MVSVPAGASVNAVESAPTKGLLTAREAGRLGFPTAVGKPVSSKKTGVTGCSSGAQVEFEDAKRATGVVSEVLVCKSASVPASLIVKAKKANAASPNLKAPKSLGANALERAAGSSTYVITWQRGRLLEIGGDRREHTRIVHQYDLHGRIHHPTDHQAARDPFEGGAATGRHGALRAP